MAIEPGISYTQTMTVKQNDTAYVHKSGKLEVFATPAMVAFMENTALKCVESLLEAGTDTVGVEIQVKHLRATAVGKQVECKATVTDSEGRKIRFEIEARDEQGVIGQAIHDRFIVDPVRFMKKLNESQ